MNETTMPGYGSETQDSYHYSLESVAFFFFFFIHSKTLLVRRQVYRITFQQIACIHPEVLTSPSALQFHQNQCLRTESSLPLPSLPLQYTLSFSAMLLHGVQISNLSLPSGTFADTIIVFLTIHRTPEISILCRKILAKTLNLQKDNEGKIVDRLLNQKEGS
jgi:hypothetical protein